MIARKLTKPQQVYLSEIRYAGERTYNGRARRTLDALKAVGLIEYEYDQIAQSKGSGIEIVERFTARPVSCRQCHGTGRRTSRWDVSEVIDCPDCGGSGYAATESERAFRLAGRSGA